jgi:hypothetical protein
MPGKIFFRDARATVTSSELIIDNHVYPLAEILCARGLRQRTWVPWPFGKFALAITTATGEWEVLRDRNAYVIFQLAQAIQAALRETRPAWARTA